MKTFEIFLSDIFIIISTIMNNIENKYHIKDMQGLQDNTHIEGAL